jgi:hypothetical protein
MRGRREDGFLSRFRSGMVGMEDGGGPEESAEKRAVGWSEMEAIDEGGAEGGARTQNLQEVVR